MPSPSGSASATAQHRAAFLRGQRENLVAIWDQIVTRAGGSVVRVSVEARGEPSADFAEQALASHHQMQALTFRNGDQTKIEAVLVALWKIEEGTYGKCEDCLEDIPWTRLRAMAATQFCVGCQGRLEEATSNRSGGGPPLRRQVLATG